MLKIEQLAVCYEHKEVIHDFSFNVKKGEVLSIMAKWLRKVYDFKSSVANVTL